MLPLSTDPAQQVQWISNALQMGHTSVCPKAAGSAVQSFCAFRSRTEVSSLSRNALLQHANIEWPRYQACILQLMTSAIQIGDGNVRASRIHPMMPVSCTYGCCRFATHICQSQRACRDWPRMHTILMSSSLLQEQDLSLQALEKRIMNLDMRVRV